MGWILCLIFLGAFAVHGDVMFAVIAALFAIAGSISEVGTAVKKLFVIADDETKR